MIGVYHLPNIQTRHPTLDAGFGFLRAVVTNSSQAPCQVRGDGDGRERVKRTSVETILRGIVSALSTSAPSASHRYPLLAQPVSICHRNCMAKKDFAFRYPLRVRWAETDAQGVVFNARYLDYADVAVTEYWRACGLRLVNPDEPLEFHVKKATVLWNAPIFPDEMIEVMCRTTKMGRSSITKIVEIHGATEDGSDDLRAEVELVSVFVDLESHRPMAFPEWIRDVFLKFDAKAENAPLLEEVPAE